MKPITFDARQVALMAQIAAFYDRTRTDFPPEYFNLQRNQKGGYQWIAR